MSNPNYPEGVTEADIDRIGEPLQGEGGVEIIDHNPKIDDLTVGEVLDWLKESYEKDSFANAFANTRRTGIIQACDLFLADKKEASYDLQKM